MELVHEITETDKILFDFITKIYKAEILTMEQQR